jgi:hypothetical protein
MALNLKQIAVHPVLFLAQDHRSQNMSLILDPVAMDRIHTPHPDREGLLVFNTHSVPMIVTSFMTVLDPIRPQLILETSRQITLCFSFESEFAEAFGPGGFFAWGPDPKYKSDMRRHETEKSKPFSLLGVIVQEIETPHLIHTLFFSNECRDRWFSWYGSEKSKVLPQSEIEFFVMRFDDPPITFNLRLAVREESTGEVRYLRSSTRVTGEWA